MTFEEKGAYMELLVLQFNRGHMSHHMILHSVGHLWDKIKDKFIQDDAGLWYNVRLDQEKEKRIKYSESRKSNRKGHTKSAEKEQDVSEHMNNHMSPHMENENINRNIDVNNIDLKPILKCLEIALRDPRWLKLNQADEAQLRKFNEYLEGQGRYEMVPVDYKSYFHHTKKKKPELFTRKLSVDDFRRMAAELDEQERKMKAV